METSFKPTSYGGYRSRSHSQKHRRRIMSTTCSQILPLQMFPFSPSQILSSHSYMQWHLSSLQTLHFHNTARLEELETILANPFVTGKERKTIRTRRSRALKSQQKLTQQIEELNYSLAQTSLNPYLHDYSSFSGLGGMLMVQAAALGGYFPPILQQVAPMAICPLMFSNGMMDGYGGDPSISSGEESYYDDGSSSWDTPPVVEAGWTLPSTYPPKPSAKQRVWFNASISSSEPWVDSPVELAELEGSDSLLLYPFRGEDDMAKMMEGQSMEAGIIRLEGPEGEGDIIIMTGNE